MLNRSITSNDVITFLDAMSDTITKPTIVVSDNASIHISKAVTNKLPEWESRGMYIYYLPTYSPELNLIEILWKKVKYEWIPFVAYESQKTLQNALSDIFNGYGQKYVINFHESF